VVGLIDQPFAVTVDPLIANDSTKRLHAEAQESGHGLAVRTYNEDGYSLIFSGLGIL